MSHKPTKVARVARASARTSHGINWLYKRILLHDEEAAFRLAEWACSLIYPKYLFSDIGRAWLEDREFLLYYRNHVAFTDNPGGNMHSADRKFLLRSLMNYARQLDGDVAECGVYHGASARLMAEAIEGTDRVLYLFDSFEGLSEPSTRDGQQWQAHDLAVDEATVRANLKTLKTRIAFMRGWIPTRFDEVANRTFSFVHIDVDLYQPTYDAMTFFYPRMTKGGIILLDDYGFVQTPGAREAVDAFIANQPDVVIEATTGQAFVIVQTASSR